MHCIYETQHVCTSIGTYRMARYLHLTALAATASRQTARSQTHRYRDRQTEYVDQ
jgi:hypothetical protein